MNRIAIPILLIVSMILIAGGAAAEDKTITINRTPKGMADEVIKIEDHQKKLADEERSRVKKERTEDSNKLVIIAETYLENQEFDKSITYYDKAIAADETNPKAHTGKLKAVNARDADELSTGLRYHEAMELYRKGNKRKAVDILVGEIKANPNNQLLREKLAEIEGR